MNDEMRKVKLSEIAHGALEELFQAALQQIMLNIKDINTDAEAKRSIDIRIAFLPNEERTEIRTAIAVSPKMVSAKGTTTTMYVGDRQVAGKLEVVESNWKQSHIKNLPLPVEPVQEKGQA